MYVMNNFERDRVRKAMATMPAMSNYTTDNNCAKMWFDTMLTAGQPVPTYLIACLHKLHYNTKAGTDSYNVGALSYIGKLNRHLQKADIPLEVVESVGSMGSQLEWRKLP